MKSYHIKQFHSINGIQLQEHPDPEPGPNEVVIRVMAVSLNRRDTYILHKTYPLAAHENIVPLSDGAGEVVAIGRNVNRFRKGDRVVGNYFPKWRDGKVGMDIMDQLGCTINGMLSEYSVMHEDWLVHLPEHLSWEEASTLPCAALTAWSAMQNLKSGQTLLVMGSGGVSTFALQFAKARGAEAIVISSRDENIERLRSVGASHVINYRNYPEWSKVVMDLTHGAGTDLVLETGGLDTIEQSLAASKFGGEIIVLNPAGSKTDVSSQKILSSVFLRLLNIHSAYVGSRVAFEEMNRAIIKNHIKPVIDKTFSFHNVHTAYTQFATGEHFGKVVIQVH